MKKMLIIEKEPLICNLLYDFFSRNGYEVRTVVNADEALKKIRLYKPDTILLETNSAPDQGVRVLEEIEREELKADLVTMKTNYNFRKDELTLKLASYNYKETALKNFLEEREDAQQH